MPRKWRVLLVDDEPETIEADIEIIKRTQLKDGSYPECTVSPDFDGAERLLEEGYFDLIVLDVRDGSAGGVDENRGRRMLESVKDLAFAPVIFHTALPHEVNDLETPFVKVVAKADHQEGKKGLVEQVMALLDGHIVKFARHISDHMRDQLWGSFTDHQNILEDMNEEQIAHMLSRRLAHKLAQNSAERFLEDEPPSDPENRFVNPVELYIYPPSSGFRQSGDMIKLGGGADGADKFFVILTPTCDLVNTNKTNSILLAEATPTDECQHRDIVDLVELSNKENPSKKEEERCKKKTLALVRHNLSNRLHYLPRTVFMDSGLVVDFGRLSTIELSELELFEPIAAIDSPYRENLIDRFTSYNSRVGTPEVDLDKVNGNGL